MNRVTRPRLGDAQWGSALLDTLAVDATSDSWKCHEAFRIDRHAAADAPSVRTVGNTSERAFDLLERLSGIRVENGNELALGFDVDVVRLPLASCCCLPVAL